MVLWEYDFPIDVFWECHLELSTEIPFKELTLLKVYVMSLLVKFLLKFIW